MIKELLEKSKTLGLGLVEDQLIDAVEFILDASIDYVKKTENKFDDKLIPQIEELKSSLIEALDKLDGEDDL